MRPRTAELVPRSLITIKMGEHMDKASIRIQLFRVQQAEGAEPLEDLLARIAADGIADRVRRCNLVDYRLEDTVAPTGRGTLWELNFVRMRDAHGPGRVSKAKKLTGFNLAVNEYFGEDTAVLYDSATRYAVIQYNHWGVRVSGLENYLSQYRSDVTNIYEFKPKLDLDAERRFKDQKIVRRVEVGIDLTKMQAADLEAGQSLTDMAEIGTKTGADRLYITLTIGSSDRKSKLKDAAKKLLTTVRKILDDDAILRLTSYGASDPEKDFEVVDLLEHKLEETEQAPVGTDRRITFENRVKALKRAKGKWAGVMQD